MTIVDTPMSDFERELDHDHHAQASVGEDAPSWGRRLRSRVRTGLLYASGSVPHLIAQSPTDVPAQIGLGLVIVSVGVIAAFSMTFAITTAFGASVLVALPVGITWGLIIFNL